MKNRTDADLLVLQQPGIASQTDVDSDLSLEWVLRQMTISSFDFVFGHPGVRSVSGVRLQAGLNWPTVSELPLWEYSSSKSLLSSSKSVSKISVASDNGLSADVLAIRNECDFVC